MRTRFLTAAASSAGAAFAAAVALASPAAGSAAPSAPPAPAARPPVTSGAPAAPASGGARAVAVVNGEKILLDDVERQIALVHLEAGEEARPVSQDPTALLERMITATLIAQEARRSGMDGIDEVRSRIQEAERATLRDLLMEQWTKGATAGATAVDAKYRDRTRQFLIHPVFVVNGSVEEFQRQLEGGADFATLAKKFRDAGKARGPDGPQLHAQETLDRGLAYVLNQMKPGEVSPPQRGDPNSAFFKLLEVRYADDPEARSEAQDVALQERRDEIVRKKTAELRAPGATVDAKLLAALDFEKEGAAKAMKTDERPVARIQGGAPITVAQLAEAMQQRFFHGMQTKRPTSVNGEKEPVLEDQINRRVVIAEARRLGLDRTPGFQSRMDRARRDILFGAYVERAIVPDVTYSDEDLKAWLAENPAEFSQPEMVRFESVAFTARPDAERALARLDAGTEFSWLAANAAGRVPRSTLEDGPFPDGLVVTTTLPEELRRSVKGARVGSGRLYAPPSGPVWLLRVAQYRPSSPAKLDEVKPAVAERVYAEKLQQAMDRTASTLRRNAKITVHATGKALRDLIRKDMGDRS